MPIEKAKRRGAANVRWVEAVWWEGYRTLCTPVVEQDYLIGHGKRHEITETKESEDDGEESEGRVW
jgi:hypothetical protein